MRKLNGSDLKYLLEKKGYSLSDVARDLDVTPQAVHMVVWGVIASQRIVSYIEKLLDFTPGKLRIARASNIKRAA
jgi:transcriptional regulator with XRE-family HTH domain